MKGLLFTLPLFLFISCKNNAVKETKPVTGGVETKPSKTGYKPAFEGQTRIGKVVTKTPYEVIKIATGIGNPWSIIPLPDGRLLVTDKKGFATIYSTEGKSLKKITGFPTVDYNSQGGLLDIALDPQFSNNRMLYWSFAQKMEGGNLTAIAKGTLSKDETTIENPVVIYQATPVLKSEYHFGSRLLFDKEGFLIFSTGERSILEGRHQAQLLSSGLGKIMRITKEGKAAPGNPFVQQPDARPEIYSYGHRNPQSLDVHPVTGDLWEAEFGPQGGDELNIIRPGKNYGWPIITYGIEYSDKRIGDSIQQKEGMEQPVYYWEPVLSPGGMIFYTGNEIPEWKNNLFIGGLSSTHIARLVIENNKVTGEERIMEDQKERIRDITQLNGQLFAVTDGGMMYRIGKK